MQPGFTEILRLFNNKAWFC